MQAALDSRLEHLALVLGYEHQTILQKLGAWAHHPRLQIVINHRYPEGQSKSLQAGLLKLRRSYPAVMFILGDQPLLDSGTIDLLLQRFHSSEKDICVPTYKGKTGNPTLFRHTLYDQLLKIGGDIGARQIIKANPERVLQVEIDNPLCFLDIDSPKDLEILQAFEKDPE